MLLCYAFCLDIRLNIVAVHPFSHKKIPVFVETNREFEENLDAHIGKHFFAVLCCIVWPGFFLYVLLLDMFGILCLSIFKKRHIFEYLL